MAVQTKSKAGEKNPKKKINWTQVCVIGFCVLIVLMCVISFSGLPNAIGNWITGTGTTTSEVAAGNPVYVNFTMNVGDIPIMDGALPFYAGTQVNQTQYLAGSNNFTLVMYADEFNQISSGVIGLSPGEKRTVAGSGASLITSITKESVADVETAKVGDVLYLPVTYTDELGDANATAYRPAVITAINGTDLIVQYGTDTINIEMVGYIKTS